MEAGYPNPFNGAVHIPYTLEAAAAVEMSVYAAAGQRIFSRTRGRLGPGRHEAIWDGRSDVGKPAASGRYLVQLKVEDGPARVLGLTLVR